MLICVSSKDDNFVPNKKYELNDGYVYTENDFSINTVAYLSIQDAIENLKAKGYEFKEDISYTSDNKSNNQRQDNGFFGFNDIFGNIFSFMNDTQAQSTEQKKAEAENMKNDILSEILKGL